MIKIIELSKKYCLEAYGGDYSEMIAQGDGLVYDNGLIKRAFNFGNGSFRDFMRYVANNRAYAKFYDLINNKYI